MRAPINMPLSRLPGQEMRATPVEFNARSKALLAQVNPTLADLMTRVEAQHPDAFEITEGMRDRERQAQLVAQGKSQTYNSRHLAGNAVDIAMIGPDGKPNWNFEAYQPIAATAKRVAAEMGVPDFVWGGDWKTLKDGVHFQVGGSPGGVASAFQPAPAAGGTPLSFGVAAPQAAPTTMEGIAGMFGGGGLSMGAPADPFAASMQQRQMAQQRRKDEQEAAETRRVALLSSVGSMFK